MEQTTPAPPMALWSQEASLLADLIDAVHSLRDVTIGLNSKKAPKSTPPAPRPKTAFKTEAQRRAAAHAELVARVLPHKAGASKPLDSDQTSAHS